MRTYLKWLFLGLLALAIAFVAYDAIVWGPTLYRVRVGFHTYETVPPRLPVTLKTPAILIFSKTNGFRHDSIEAGNAALVAIAERRGWSAFVTENGAVFNPDQLRKFKVVVWDNASGDVLTIGQRAAFKSWLEAGGGFVGIHGAGDDSHTEWPWYVDTLIGARFIGHTLNPQFPEATIHVEDAAHPATRLLPATWVRKEEWYSFATSPRAKGYHILASVDERTYQPVMKFVLPFFTSTKDLRMGDHPVIWAHCVGRGRVFYSALGHQVSAYAEPAHLKMLEGAIAWAAGLEGAGCRN